MSDDGTISCVESSKCWLHLTAADIVRTDQVESAARIDDPRFNDCRQNRGLMSLACEFPEVLYVDSSYM